MLFINRISFHVTKKVFIFLKSVSTLVLCCLVCFDSRPIKPKAADKNDATNMHCQAGRKDIQKWFNMCEIKFNNNNSLKNN